MSQLFAAESSFDVLLYPTLPCGMEQYVVSQRERDFLICNLGSCCIEGNIFAAFLQLQFHNYIH